MATYRQIQERIKKTDWIVVKTCWIAHVKEMCGLNPRNASNRISNTIREQPCPPAKVPIIKKTLRHFGMV
jgi:hypothetical protein